jgi:leader peptidase (prepilin peptidase)/N-methyltransferase
MLSTILIATLLSLLIGSFLNVVIYRLPQMLESRWQREAREIVGDDAELDRTGDCDQALVSFNLAWPASHCPACRQPIRAHHNIPLLSWLWLRGRCAQSAAPIALRYPLVECLAGAAGGLAVWQFGSSWTAAAAATLSFALLALTFIDLDTHLLPDELTIPLIWLGLLCNTQGLFAPLQEAVIGAVFGYLGLWIVYHGFRIVTGKEGMGFGDFKLLSALGAWFGWQLLPAILLLASGVGAAIGLALIFTGRQHRDAPIPFGPFLAAAGMTALYLRVPIVELMGLQ